MRSLRVLVLVFGCSACSRGSTTTVNSKSSSQAMREIAKAIADDGKAKVTGSIHSAGARLGTWDVALSDCQSGELNGFYGVDLFVAGTTNIRLRYVHDEATGEVIKIFYPDKKDTAAVFNHNDVCKVLEGSVSKMNVTTRVYGRGNIRNLEGHVSYDCTYDDGTGHVTGDVKFSNCH